MVNERQANVYNQSPVNIRKKFRSEIRARVQKQNGQHHVSAKLAWNF